MRTLNTRKRIKFQNQKQNICANLTIGAFKNEINFHSYTGNQLAF